ncbi:MAG: flagellar filament capping protein FliD [Bordetella sp.]|uniref:flagellar filament capping protein FliD n=1 Tax=Bordetella sp. TaxID=28081 RepID=UPI003F7C5B4A
MTTSAISNTANAGLITSLGVGSSLDLAGLLSQLQAAELAPTTVINNQISSAQTKISAYATLQSAIQAVQSAAATLGQASTFSSVKSSVTGTDITATAATGAIAGSYKVVVTALAQADQLQSSTAIPTATAGSQSFGSGGSITITLANGSSQTINLTGNSDTSLQGVINAINNDSSAGVNATAVNNGSGGEYLMITGSQTGTTNAISSISVSGNSTLASALTYTAGATSGNTMTLSQTAQNAAATINGIAVTSSSNTISNAINDVTLTLNSVTASSGSDTLNLTANASVPENAVQAFVTAYNALQTTIGSLTAFNTADSTSSPLTGDNTTNNARNAIAQALRVYIGTGTLQSLADLGITTDSHTGKLNLNTTTLNNAITTDPTDVSALFTSASGLAANIQSAANTILGNSASGITGTLSYATSGLQQTITALQSQYSTLLSTVTGDMNRYRTEFTNLDTLLATMNSTSTYLTQQFAAMSKSSG